MNARRTLLSLCIVLPYFLRGQEDHCDSTLLSQFTVSVSGLTVTLTDVSPVGGLTTTISAWTLGDGTAMGGNPVTHTYTGPGTYEICLVTLFCNPNFLDTCYDEHCEMVTVGAVGLAPEATAALLQMNLVNDQLVVLTSTAGRRTEARVMDARGRILREGTTRGDRLSLDVGGLAPGAYLVTLTDGIQSRSTRFVLGR